MTSVQSVTVGLGLSDYSGDATTPTTPRAPVMPSPRPNPSDSAQHEPARSDELNNLPAANTPTAANFGGVSGQRPLPTSPICDSGPAPDPSPEVQDAERSKKRDSQLSLQSDGSQDIEMADSDGEMDGGSDGETIDQETGRPSKKKKGQRFFCTDFPPCKLSFTRSEHLARHIRKHTGERPFQCHCSRRFSRLDNLRQHAQTVHLNEDIPIDSLAATGTRFQRQIRTDRVSRPPGGRSRASTASSTGGGHHRGHGRNLSTSSIASTMSTVSTISRDDARRRPTPIIMASDASKPRLTLDVLRSQASTPPGQTSFFRESSEGVSTPTSTTYSTGGHSPGYGSSIGSPASNARNSGYWNDRGHNRRLSVPSSHMPYQSPHANTYGSPYLSPLPSSHASNFSTTSSSFGSPINPAYNLPSSREAAEAELRRRTWHPTPHNYTNFSRPTIMTNFSRPATSGLVYNETPDAPPSSYPPPTSAAGSHSQRLPGIETFDAPRRPMTPPLSQSARPGSPMHVDAPSQPAFQPPAVSSAQPGPPDRKGHASWDMSLHQNLTKLDLRSGPPQQEPRPWPQQPQTAEQRPTGEMPHPSNRLPIIHQEPMKPPGDQMDYPSPNLNRAKRQGWYAGPPPAPSSTQLRASPGGSTSSEGVPRTPTAPAVEHHPSIMHSNGYIESVPAKTSVTQDQQARPPVGPHPTSWPLGHGHESQTYQHRNSKEMTNLDVLVAAATSESNAAPQA